MKLVLEDNDKDFLTLFSEYILPIHPMAMRRYVTRFMLYHKMTFEQIDAWMRPRFKNIYLLHLKMYRQGNAIALTNNIKEPFAKHVLEFIPTLVEIPKFDGKIYDPLDNKYIEVKELHD